LTASCIAAAVQRIAIEAERHRFTFRQTRRTVLMTFSMMLVQASERRCAAEFVLQQLGSTSTANAKGTGRRLDFNFALILRARDEPESAARSLNGNATCSLVWIIHKLVKPDA
jgi:hypothetical protein